MGTRTARHNGRLIKIPDCILCSRDGGQRREKIPNTVAVVGIKWCKRKKRRDPVSPGRGEKGTEGVGKGEIKGERVRVKEIVELEGGEKRGRERREEKRKEQK